jgi:alginate O-acetyltransferase complex protein AlgI
MPPSLHWNAGLDMQVGLGWCAVLGAVAALAPNSNRIGTVVLNVLTQARVQWQAMAAGVVACVSLLLVLINTARDSVSAFIYFNF